MRSLALLFIVFSAYCIPTSLRAQRNSESLKHSSKGYELERQGLMQQALYEYNAAIAADPKYAYPVARIAAMYQRLHNYPLAIHYYQRALSLDSSADVYTFFNLGVSYRLVTKHDSAVIFYKEFIRRMQPVSASDSEAMRKADYWIKFNLGCLAERAKPKNTTEPALIIGEVNSKYDDFGPSITADGETMYFTSRRASTNKTQYEETRDYGDDLFVTHRDTSGKWGKPSAMQIGINSADDEGAASVTADGQSLYCSLCRRPDGYGECDLYVSELGGDQWSKPQNLGAAVNSPKWDAQPSLTPDGHTMYFASKRAGSIEGSEDIWVAYKNTDGSWGKPVNLGEPINTAFSERSPFIAADGKTLYFSSNGHPGFGNHDLFVTHKLEDGGWAVPINLGAPINEAGDDVFLTIPARGDLMYYSSQRANPKGNLDIYQAKLPREFQPGPVTVVAGMVFDAKTKSPLGATIEVSDLKTSEVVAVYRTNTLTGKFFIPLGTGKTYGVTASAPKYTFYSEHYTVPDTIAYRELSHDIPLTRVDSLFVANNTPDTGTSSNDTTTNPTKNTVESSDLGVTVQLNNIFFDFNKATLRDESIPELRTLMSFLNQYPKLRIEIAGHTDSIGTPEINKKLSQARAEAVRQYLMTNGIAAARLTAKGYGDTKPIATNENEQGRQQNRRTEFKLLRRSQK